MTTLGAPEFLDQLATATREDCDAQPYGVIELDDHGKVLIYNRAESEFSGLDRSLVEGRSFFSHVAPCSNNRLFYGRFRAGVQQGEMDVSFRYTFTYLMDPTFVAVRMIRRKGSPRNWVFIQKT